MANIPIVLEDNGTPLLLQIYNAIKSAIENRLIAEGELLPPLIEMATRLGVSRHTVLRATKLLMKQGYVEPSGRAWKVKAVYAVRLTQLEEDDLQFESEPSLDFSPERCVILSKFASKALSTQTGTRDSSAISILDTRLARQWRRTLINKASERSLEGRFLTEGQGLLVLREEVSRYLNRFHYAKSTPERLLVFSTRTAALDFLFRLVLSHEDVVMAENPCAPNVRSLLALHSFEVQAVDVDEHGIRTHALTADSEASLVYVSPARNQTTGTTMSFERRQAVLKWASLSNAVILEDSPDSDYWHTGEPMPCIQGLDESDCVFYVSSFSEILSPLCNLNFAVVPERWQLEAVSLIKELGPGCSILEQEILASLLQAGMIERHWRANLDEVSSLKNALEMPPAEVSRWKDLNFSSEWWHSPSSP